MAFRAIRHPIGPIEGRQMFILDTIKVTIAVDIERSARTPTAETAEQRLHSWLQDLASGAAQFFTARLGSVPDGLVVEITIE